MLFLWHLLVQLLLEVQFSSFVAVISVGKTVVGGTVQRCCFSGFCQYNYCWRFSSAVLFLWLLSVRLLLEDQFSSVLSVASVGTNIVGG